MDGHIDENEAEVINNLDVLTQKERGRIIKDLFSKYGGNFQYDELTGKVRSGPPSSSSSDREWPEIINITAATEDMTLEHVKDAVRSICIDNITQSGLYDALFEVNNTGFTPTPEFWRNNTDNDMTGTDILRSDDFFV